MLKNRGLNVRLQGREASFDIIKLEAFELHYIARESDFAGTEVVKLCSLWYSLVILLTRNLSVEADRKIGVKLEVSHHQSPCPHVHYKRALSLIRPILIPSFLLALGQELIVHR